VLGAWRGRITAGLLLGALAGAGSALAEMGSGDYQPPVPARSASPEERLREAERQVRERAEAERRVREASRREEEARLARQRLLDERPYAVRLTESRCAGCHGEGYYRERAHGTLGWLLVLLRMEWFNGARFEPGERRVIVAHLAGDAGAAREVAEFGLLVAGALGLFAWFWRRWAQNRCKTPPGH